jgi:hypothetical protein
MAPAVKALFFDVCGTLGCFRVPRERCAAANALTTLSKPPTEG